MELKILPLGKDYPIYLQKEQKAELDKAPDGILLSLDGIQVLERSTQEYTTEEWQNRRRRHRFADIDDVGWSMSTTSAKRLWKRP